MGQAQKHTPSARLLRLAAPQRSAISAVPNAHVTTSGLQRAEQRRRGEASKFLGHRRRLHGLPSPPPLAGPAVAARDGLPLPSLPRLTPPNLRRRSPHGGGPCFWSASRCSRSSDSVTPRRKWPGRSARRWISLLVSCHRSEIFREMQMEAIV
jgi:hypothetical protein